MPAQRRRPLVGVVFEAAVISRSHDPVSRVPFAVLTPNDSSAFERSKFNEDFAALCIRVSAYFRRDFVPAKFSVLPADHFAYLLADRFAGDVAHRQSLASFRPSEGRIPGSGRELSEFTQLLARDSQHHRPLPELLAAIDLEAFAEHWLARISRYRRRE